MTITRRDHLTPGLRLVLLLPIIPVLVLVIVFMSTDEETGPLAMAVNVAVLFLIIVVEQTMHARITVRHNSVRMSLWPFFRRTIPFREIARVDNVKVDPMRDYGGWGVRGKSRSERGMLFSVGGHHGLMVTTRHGRRYVATASEPVDDLVETLRGLTGEGTYPA